MEYKSLITPEERIQSLFADEASLDANEEKNWFLTALQEEGILVTDDYLEDTRYLLEEIPNFELTHEEVAPIAIKEALHYDVETLELPAIAKTASLFFAEKMHNDFPELSYSTKELQEHFMNHVVNHDQEFVDAISDVLEVERPVELDALLAEIYEDKELKMPKEVKAYFENYATSLPKNESVFFHNRELTKDVEVIRENNLENQLKDVPRLLRYRAAQDFQDSVENEFIHKFMKGRDTMEHSESIKEGNVEYLIGQGVNENDVYYLHEIDESGHLLSMARETYDKGTISVQRIEAIADWADYMTQEFGDPEPVDFSKEDLKKLPLGVGSLYPDEIEEIYPGIDPATAQRLSGDFDWYWNAEDDLINGKR